MTRGGTRKRWDLHGESPHGRGGPVPPPLRGTRSPITPVPTPATPPSTQTPTVRPAPNQGQRGVRRRSADDAPATKDLARSPDARCSESEADGASLRLVGADAPAPHLLVTPTSVVRGRSERRGPQGRALVRHLSRGLETGGSATHLRARGGPAPPRVSRAIPPTLFTDFGR